MVLGWWERLYTKVLLQDHEVLALGMAWTVGLWRAHGCPRRTAEARRRPTRLQPPGLPPGLGALCDEGLPLGGRDAPCTRPELR